MENRYVKVSFFNRHGALLCADWIRADQCNGSPSAAHRIRAAGIAVSGWQDAAEAIIDRQSIPSGTEVVTTA